MILAGGRSRRFGSDKALALVSGKPMIAHAVDLVLSVGLAPCVITEKSRDYSFLNCPIYFDRESFGGPLAGLERACEVFPNEKILVLTCDMPLLKPKDLRRLLEASEAKAPVTLYRLHENLFQPFPGIYDTRLKNRIRRAVKTGPSMQHFLSTLEDILEISPGTGRGRFVNRNKPSD